MVKRRRSNVATETSDSKNATKNPKNRSPTSLVEGERDQQQQDDHEQSVDGEEEEEEEVGKEEKGKEDIPQKKDSPDKGEDGDVELIGKRKRKRTRTRKKKGAAEDDDGEAVGGGIEDGGGGEGGEGGVPARVTDTVYVEGIPWTCDESDVREFFKGCGKIAGVRLPRWQDSGRPRGYGHVAFASTSGARAAFGLDGQYLKGRYLTVQAPQEPATEKARRVNRTAEQPRGCRTVFVKNLPYDVDEDAVQEAISGCGRVASVRLAMWNHTRKLKGFGYVEFATERGAETCVRTQEKLSIGGRPIVVDFETGAPKGSFRRQDGAQIKKTSADAGLGKGKAPKFKVHT